MRVAVKYDGLITTTGQLRYDEMCQAFTQMADLVQMMNDGHVQQLIRYKINLIYLLEQSQVLEGIKFRRMLLKY